MTDTHCRTVGPFADAANLLAGTAVFTLPWTFDATAAAAWNAWACGILVAALSLAALLHLSGRETWISLILGIWIAASPWIFGLTAMTGVLWNHLVLGLLVAGAAAWRLWSAYSGTACQDPADAAA